MHIIFVMLNIDLVARVFGFAMLTENARIKGGIPLFLSKQDVDPGGDCPNGACEDRCFFGPPLPIPNAEIVPVSHCVIRTVAEDAGGTAECLGGAVNVDLPLRGAVRRHGRGGSACRHSPCGVKRTPTR